MVKKELTFLGVPLEYETELPIIDDDLYNAAVIKLAAVLRINEENSSE